MSDTDLQLLARYIEAGAEDAFAELVHRHLNLVYSAALRQVRSPQLAEEVAQAVFVDLSRNARRLRPDTIVTAWLYAVTRRTAIDVVRRESRRQLREQIATEMNAMNATATDWTHIEPLLDEAVSALDDTDRAAVLLRYFENKSLREVGAALGTSDDAAQKRVSRAVERLREFFAKRGVTVGASGLVVVISANAVQAAPAGLAITISTATALAGTTLATTTTATTIKAVAMTTLQKTLVAATVAVLAGTGIYEARQASQLRTQVRTLRQQQAPLTEQLSQLNIANERLSNQVVQARDAQALSQAQFSELLRLRGNSAVVRADSLEIARLKSTLAEQAGKAPDYLTNAMAVGLGTAEKFKLKDAQASLDRMKKALNLTEDQTQAISNIMQKHIRRQSEMAMQAITGNMTPEQRQAMIAEGTEKDGEIEALFTSEQLAAYPEFKQSEKTAAADKSAISEAGRIADDFGLSKEQQEQIHAAFYRMNLNEASEGLNKETIAAAKKNGSLEEVMSLSIEASKSKLEEKLKILGSVLTPEQINAYREDQMQKINMTADAMKMLLPQKPAGTANQP